MTAENILSNDNENGRPSWDEYFMEVVDAISKRATCARGRSGCVIARDKRILVTGYVGSHAGFPHCDDAGHKIKRITDLNGEITEHCSCPAKSESLGFHLKVDET